MRRVAISKIGQISIYEFVGLVSFLEKDRLKRRFIATHVDLRSFKPVTAVEILIAYDLGSQIFSTISAGEPARR